MGKYKDSHGYTRFSHWLGLDGRTLGEGLTDAFGRYGIDFGEALRSIVAGFTGESATGAEREMNAFNAQQAQLNRDFEERMSNTAYQRQVQDMRAAGINPAMSMGQASSGASVPSGSAASAVSPSGGMSMSDLLQLASLPMQLKNLRSETALKESETKVNDATARNIGVQADFNEQTFALRKDALELANNLSRVQKDKIYQEKQESIARMHQLEESALTEASKRAVNEAQAILYRAEASDIVALQPYKIQLTQAQTSAQKASAALSAAQELYQRGLLNRGYIDALCSELESHASQYGAEAEIKGITASIKGGHLLAPAEMGDSKLANILEDVWNGVFTESINNGFAIISNLLDYMPPVLLTPKAPTDSYVDTSSSTFGPKGGLKSTTYTKTHSYK